MLNRSLKWLAGAALAAAALATAPSLTEAHAHYTGTLPPSLVALATTPVRTATATHARSHSKLSAHHRSASKLSTSKKAHKLSKKHHSSKKHHHSAAKHKAV